jgi:hypothetical protein
MCGKQTQIKNVRGAPIRGVPGCKLAWLCLCDENGEVFTRIGTFTLCSTCEPDCDKIKTELANKESRSGVKSSEPEFARCSSMKIEIAKEFIDG